MVCGAGEGHFYGEDEVIAVKLQTINAYHALTAAVTEGMTVVNYVIFIFARDFYNLVMPCACGNICILLENLSYAVKWAKRRVGYGIGDRIIRTTPAAF